MECRSEKQILKDFSRSSLGGIKPRFLTQDNQRRCSRPPRVLECLHPHYRNCLTILFFTGLNFGEMAALKWKNVHLDRKTAKICETLVYGEEGRTKTKKSNRDIDVLPPAIEALIDQ
jgi:integrase